MTSSIEELDLSVRVFNSLKRTGITTIGDVLDMLDRGPDAMLAIRNFGEKSLDELVEKLRDKGYLDAEVQRFGSGWWITMRHRKHGKQLNRNSRAAPGFVEKPGSRSVRT